MKRYQLLIVTLLAALVPLACTTTQTGQPGGARPEIIFDDVGGIWQPAIGADRDARPAIPDGQRYLASGPYQVNLKDIPASAHKPTDLTDLEYLRGGGRIESQLPDEAMAKLRAEARNLRASPAIQDPAAGTVTALAAATASAGPGFESIDLSECCGGGGSVPPDPELAAGPNHVIAVVNVAFEIYNTGGVSLRGPTTFASFFSSVPSCTSQFDPNAIYDESADRFIIGVDGNGTDYCIAVSQTGDPTGAWNLYSFQTGDRRNFFDYPHAGVGEDAIYLGANIFGAVQFKEGRVWAINKASLYAGQAPQVVSYSLGSDGTPQPMNLHGWNQGTWPSDGVHYILTDGQVYDGRNIGVWSWSNPFSGGAPAKKGEVDLVAASGATVGMPVDAPQQNGGNLQANDWRVQDAEYRDGYIWTSNAQSCNPGGGTVNCVRWAQIDPSIPTVIAAGVYGSAGQYRSFPDLAVDACGNMMMGYSKTSSSSNPSVYALGRDYTGVTGEMSVKPAEAVYAAFDGAPYRWGDYTGMTIGPDGKTFWYLGEYSKNSSYVHGNWGTWINSFTFGCDTGGTVNTPPVAVITLIDCPAGGLSCSYDGSGSYDPDAGGAVTSYAWDFGDGSSGSGATPSHTYQNYGTYTVKLTVTDDGGAVSTNTASEQITLKNPAAATTMTVASVFVDTVNVGGGSKSPRATVVINDDQGSPVGSVNVSGTFDGDAAGSDTAPTDGSGTAVLVSPNSKKGKVKFTFCVTDVSGSATLDWDGVPACASN